jgi:TorA maturation chaperone TorD
MEMIEQEDREFLLVNRFFLYELLSHVFMYEPSEDLLVTLRAPHTSDVFEFISADGDADANGATPDGDRPCVAPALSPKALYVEVLKSVESSTPPTSLAKLQRDYTCLFIGPGKLPVPLWESVHITGENLLFQQRTLEVREFYLRAAFQTTTAGSQPDDHIATELAFLSALAQEAYEAACNDDEQACGQSLRVSRDFLDEHLLLWVGAFANGLAQVEQLGKVGRFYPLMASLAASISALDLRLLKKPRFIDTLSLCGR